MGPGARLLRDLCSLALSPPAGVTYQRWPWTGVDLGTADQTKAAGTHMHLGSEELSESKAFGHSDRTL